MDEADAGSGKRRYVLCTPTPETLLLDERTTILFTPCICFPAWKRAGGGWLAYSYLHIWRPSIGTSAVIGHRPWHRQLDFRAFRVPIVKVVKVMSNTYMTRCNVQFRYRYRVPASRQSAHSAYSPSATHVEMRLQKRPAANGCGCCDDSGAVRVRHLRPSRPAPQGGALSRDRIVAVVMFVTLFADGAAAAAASASSNPPPPAALAAMTEREKYEISRQLAKVDPLSRPISNNDNNDTPSKSAGITLPESSGESALIDRETGQIFWQGGPGVLYIGTSSTLSSLGVRHVRASALSLMLVTAALSALAAKLRDMLQTIDVVGPWWQVASFLAKCTIVLPRFDAWFVALIAVLYLIEAHSCSTRRYLANALSGPAAVEDYIEGLRQAPPVARWTVRCFHYEQRKSLAWLSFL